MILTKQKESDPSSWSYVRVNKIIFYRQNKEQSRNYRHVLKLVTGMKQSYHAIQRGTLHLGVKGPLVRPTNHPLQSPHVIHQTQSRVIHTRSSSTLKFCSIYKETETVEA